MFIQKTWEVSTLHWLFLLINYFHQNDSFYQYLTGLWAKISHSSFKSPGRSIFCNTTVFSLVFFLIVKIFLTFTKADRACNRYPLSASAAGSSHLISSLSPYTLCPLLVEKQIPDTVLFHSSIFHYVLSKAKNFKTYRGNHNIIPEKI